MTYHGCTMVGAAWVATMSIFHVEVLIGTVTHRGWVSWMKATEDLSDYFAAILPLRRGIQGASRS